MNKKPSIKKNAVLNTIRQVSKIILPLITFPYVTRVLQAENYGRVNFCASIVSYFLLFAGLGIGNYAVREGAGLRDDKEKLADFSSQMLSANLICSVLSFAVLAFLALFWHRETDYKLILLIQGIEVLLSAFSLEWLYSIYEDYLFITTRGIVVHLCFIVLVFAFIKTPEDYILYAVFAVAVRCAGFAVNFVHARKYTHLRITYRLDIKKHLRPVLLLFSNSVLVSIYLNSDITMLGIMRSDTEVGLYQVAVNIYGIIKGMLNAIIAVIIPRLSYYVKTKHGELFQSLASDTFKVLVLLIFPVLTGLVMISKNAVIIVAGIGYSGGITALRILCFALLFAIVANFYVSGVLIPNSRDKHMLVATSVSAVVNIMLNFYFIPRWGLNGAAVTTLIAEITVTVLSMYFSKDLFRISGVLGTLFAALAGCAGIVLVCLASERLCMELVWDTTVKIAFSCIVYGTVILALQKDFILGFLKNREW